MNTSTTRTYEQQWCCEFTDLAAQLPGAQFKRVLPGDSSMSDLKIMEILKTRGIDHTTTTPAEALSQLVKVIPDIKTSDMIIPVGLQKIQDALRHGFKPGDMTLIAAMPSPNSLPKSNVMLSTMQQLLADGQITQEQFDQYIEQARNYHAQFHGEAPISEEEWLKHIKKLGLEPLPRAVKE